MVDRDNTLRLDGDGVIYADSQVQDYCLRGAELENYNVLDYFVDTYEEDRKKINVDRQSVGDNRAIELRGRPSQPRSEYGPSHPRYARKVRVVRADSHRTLPNIVGRWFPKRDPALSQHSYYCASMLILLKPWRSLRDLKAPGESWTQAFDNFSKGASARTTRIMSGTPHVTYICPPHINAHNFCRN